MKLEFKLVLGILLLMFVVVQFDNAYAQTITPDFIYEQNAAVDLKVFCFNNGFCTAAATCNITTTYPNSTIVVDNVLMTNQISYHNYTFAQNVLNARGDYQVTGVCIDGAANQQINFIFRVTPTGEDLTTSRAIIYLIMLVGVTAMFLLLFYFMLSFEFGNFIDEDSGEFKINWKKYFKLFLVPVNWVLLMWIFGIARSISANYLYLPGIGLMFEWAYQIMLYTSFPILIVCLYGILVWFINDKRIYNAIERGTPFE